MMKSIRLIAFDLDGSILNDSGEISDYSVNVLNRAAESGIKLVPISGRSVQQILPVISKVRGIDYIVASNGATIVETDSGRIIKKHPLDKKIVLDIYDLCISLGAEPVVFINEHLCREDYSEFLKKKRNKDFKFDEFHKAVNLQINRLGLRNYLFSTEYTIEKIIMRLDSLEGKRVALEKLKRYQNISVSYGLKLSIEINAIGVNKGVALDEISKIYNIPLVKTMCIGDGVNDIPMIEKAGIAVVMNNALEELEGYGDYITLSNNDDGAAKAIEAMLLVL